MGAVGWCPAGNRETQRCDVCCEAIWAWAKEPLEVLVDAIADQQRLLCSGTASTFLSPRGGRRSSKR